MKYLTIILFIATTTPAFAQLSVDSGIRTPQSMKVSVVDGTDTQDKKDSQNVDLSIPDASKDERHENTSQKEIDEVRVPSPTMPETPHEPDEPKKAKKQVIKPIQKMKIRRSIADDRIDDSYVQEMIKKNHLFTNDYKTKNPNK